MKKVQRRAFALTRLVCLLLAPASALAFQSVDTIPWPTSGVFPAYAAEGAPLTGLFVHGGIMFDNNVLRRERKENDAITRAGVGFRHDQRVVGRQRLIVDARGDAYYFDNFTDLSHFAYSALGDWRWEAGNDFSGSIVLGRDRRLVDFSQATVIRTSNDPVTTTRVGASAAYTGVPDFRLRAGAAAARGERSSRPDAEIRAGSITAGIDWVSPLRNTLGVEYRSTYGDAPVPEFVTALGTFVENDFREKEIAAVATYAPLPQFRFVGRVGRTERTYTQIAGRDFEGITGRFGLDWLPGNKTVLGFEAYRAPQSVIDVAAGHVLITGIAFAPRWAVTNKLVLSSRLSRERRQFEGDPATTAGAPVLDEVVTLMRFAVGWEPQRHWQFSLGFDRGEREANTAGRDYQYNAVVFNAQWTY